MVRKRHESDGRDRRRYSQWRGPARASAARVGTVEPGKIADLIVVDGDPLTDIASLGNVVCTIQGGRIVMRNGL